MTTVKQNFTIRRGASEDIRFTLRDEENAKYTNFTGFSFEWEISEHINSAAVITVADGSFTKTDASGTLDYTMPSADSVKLTAMVPYTHELHATYSGTAYVYSEGDITVKDSMLD